MTYDPDGRLWNRKMGIRFSPKPDPLYPELDTSRFLHTSTNTADTESAGPGPQADEDYDGRPHGQPTISPSNELDELAHAGQPGIPIEADSVTENEAAAIEGSEEKLIVEHATPPVTSLEYQIPLESFLQARKSAKGSRKSFWSHTLYRNTGERDGTKTNVKVHYCTSKHTMEYICQKYFLGEEVLGFDLEWNPNTTKEKGPRQNVSLIQLASPSRIGLFHCALFVKDDFVAPSFKQIMEDPKVNKVGVAIKADCTRLGNYLGVNARGIFELSHLYKVVKYTKEAQPNMINKSLVTLARQVQEYLGLPLYKGDSVRSSDWSRMLSERQISYSASDAYAGVQLYHVLDGERKRLNPCPPRPYHAELGMPLPVPLINIDEDNGVTTEGETESSFLGSGTSTQALSDVRARFRDARVSAADLKMQQYRFAQRRPVSAGPSALRAYFIWNGNADLSPEAIAKLLREPPLQTQTVVSYILKAVTEEHLPYDRSRMKDELLSTLNDAAKKVPKYQALIQACKDITPDAQQ